MPYRILSWPVVGLVITGAIHFTAEALWPDLNRAFVPAVVAPLLLAYGAWVGALTIRSGGSYGMAFALGAIVGILPVLLEVVGFGVLLGRGVGAGVLGGVFNLSMVLFGTLLGSGLELSLGRPTHA